MLLMKAKQVDEECKFRMSIYSSINFLSLRPRRAIWEHWKPIMMSDTVLRGRWKAIQTLFKNYTLNLVIRMCFQVYTAIRWSDRWKKKFKMKIHLTRSEHFNEVQLIKLLYKLILSPAKFMFIFFRGVQNQLRVALIPNEMRAKWKLKTISSS